mmetsp:Transcript_8480/g.17000  ORF Transcript_8480/g.17000 Transcript_8480/m.17000 type:complete len:219 (+) Transcript_8480:531-1187(+)
MSLETLTVACSADGPTSPTRASWPGAESSATLTCRTALASATARTETACLAWPMITTRSSAGTTPTTTEAFPSTASPRPPSGRAPRGSARARTRTSSTPTPLATGLTSRPLRLTRLPPPWSTSALSPLRSTRLVSSSTRAESSPPPSAPPPPSTTPSCSSATAPTKLTATTSSSRTPGLIPGARTDTSGSPRLTAPARAESTPPSPPAWPNQPNYPII